MNKHKVIFQKDLPSLRPFGNGAILIHDRFFTKQKDIDKWIKKFPRRYAVKSGEKLKNIDEFSKHIKKIFALAEGLSTQDITIITLGGGSVGDFGGFVASVLKRGVRLVHIPSTWLAAVDSAHGGKTGLNVSRIKNQVGTFYPAHQIYLVRSLLASQPQARIFEAFGEVLKISLIEGRKLWSDIRDVKRVDSNLYWRLLPQMVKAKYRIVDQDPKEQKGIRHILNLGHTMGHVWESQLKIPHGLAVLVGLAFAIEWSFHRGMMSSKQYYEIRLAEVGSYLPDRFDLKKFVSDSKSVRRFLLQDKKMVRNRKIRFVFLRGSGFPVMAEVSLRDLTAELDRQSQ